MTPVSHPIARALVKGLSHDSIVVYNDAREIYPEVNLVDFESATKDALTRLHPLKIERVWESDRGSLPENYSNDRDIKKTSEFYVSTLKYEGFFIDHREIRVDAEPGKVFDTITNFRMRRFIVDTIEPDHLLLLRSQRKTPGDGWVEWKVGHVINVTYLTQTIYFTPRGPAGFLYWYLSYPFHAIIFRRLIKRIARNSVVK